VKLIDMKHTLLGLAVLACLCTGCKDDEEDIIPEPELVDTVPAFYLPEAAEEYGSGGPDFVLVADASDQIDEPWDLAFHPGRKRELWVLNKGTDRLGGSTVTISQAGLPGHSADWRRDGNAWHFMAMPTALAFSQENGNWATTAGLMDANRQNSNFTGPSLWSSNMDIYARPSGGNGSHIDMLHASPWSMGIESERDNIFWVFDGHNKHIVRYDFVDDHGPGNDYHGDGLVHRFTEVKVLRDDNVPSHMEMDKETGWLYIVDTGNKRILKLNTASGTKKSDLPLINEPLTEHWEMEGADWKIFASENLQKPSGIALAEGVLYVSDYETGEIIAYNLENGWELARINTGFDGIMGIDIDVDGKLWFVSSKTNEVYRVEPQ